MLSSLITPIRFVYDRGANPTPALLPTDVKDAIFDMTAQNNTITFKISDGLGSYTDGSIAFGDGTGTININTGESAGPRVYLDLITAVSGETIDQAKLNAIATNLGILDMDYNSSQADIRLCFFGDRLYVNAPKLLYSTASSSYQLDSDGNNPESYSIVAVDPSDGTIDLTKSIQSVNTPSNIDMNLSGFDMTAFDNHILVVSGGENSASNDDTKYSYLTVVDTQNRSKLIDVDIRSILITALKTVDAYSTVSLPSSVDVRITGIAAISNEEVVLSYYYYDVRRNSGSTSPVFLSKFRISNIASLSSSNLAANFTHVSTVFVGTVNKNNINNIYESGFDYTRNEQASAARPLLGIDSDGTYVYGTTFSGATVWDASDLTRVEDRDITYIKVNSSTSFRGIALTNTKLYTYQRVVGVDDGELVRIGGVEISVFNYAGGGRGSLGRAIRAINSGELGTENLNTITIDDTTYSVSGAENVQSDWDVTDTTSDAFILNKPTILQSDWNVTDTTSLAYIKNKPTITSGENNIQSDWNVTDTTSDAYILNKPTLLQSDWNVTDTSSLAFIKNKPTSLLNAVLTDLSNVDSDLTDSEKLSFKSKLGITRGGTLITAEADTSRTLKMIVVEDIPSGGRDDYTLTYGTDNSGRYEVIVLGSEQVGSLVPDDHHIQQSHFYTSTFRTIQSRNKIDFYVRESALDSTKTIDKISLNGTEVPASLVQNFTATISGIALKAIFSDSALPENLRITPANNVRNVNIGYSDGTWLRQVSAESVIQKSLSKADAKTWLDVTASSGEENVQSDWDVTDTTSDAFIKNKPTIPSGGGGGASLNYDLPTPDPENLIKVACEETTRGTPSDESVTATGTGNISSNDYYTTTTAGTSPNTVTIYKFNSDATSVPSPTGGVNYAHRFVILIPTASLGGKTPSLFYYGSGGSLDRTDGFQLTADGTQGTQSRFISQEVRLKYGTGPWNTNIRFTDGTLYFESGRTEANKVFDLATMKEWIGFGKKSESDSEDILNALSDTTFESDSSNEELHFGTEEEDLSSRFNFVTAENPTKIYSDGEKFIVNLQRVNSLGVNQGSVIPVHYVYQTREGYNVYNVAIETAGIYKALGGNKVTHPNIGKAPVDNTTLRQALTDAAGRTAKEQEFLSGYDIKYRTGTAFNFDPKIEQDKTFDAIIGRLTDTFNIAVGTGSTANYGYSRGSTELAGASIGSITPDVPWLGTFISSGASSVLYISSKSDATTDEEAIFASLKSVIVNGTEYFLGTLNKDARGDWRYLYTNEDTTITATPQNFLSGIRTVGTSYNIKFKKTNNTFYILDQGTLFANRVGGGYNLGNTRKIINYDTDGNTERVALGLRFNTPAKDQILLSANYSGSDRSILVSDGSNLIQTQFVPGSTGVDYNPSVRAYVDHAGESDSALHISAQTGNVTRRGQFILQRSSIPSTILDTNLEYRWKLTIVAGHSGHNITRTWNSGKLSYSTNLSPTTQNIEFTEGGLVYPAITLSLAGANNPRRLNVSANSHILVSYTITAEIEYFYSTPTVADSYQRSRLDRLRPGYNELVISYQKVTSTTYAFDIVLNGHASFASAPALTGYSGDNIKIGDLGNNTDFLQRVIAVKYKAGVLMPEGTLFPNGALDTDNTLQPLSRRFNNEYAFGLATPYSSSEKIIDFRTAVETPHLYINEGDTLKEVKSRLSYPYLMKLDQTGSSDVRAINHGTLIVPNITTDTTIASTGKWWTLYKGLSRQGQVLQNNVPFITKWSGAFAFDMDATYYGYHLIRFTHYANENTPTQTPRGRKFISLRKVPFRINANQEFNLSLSTFDSLTILRNLTSQEAQERQQIEIEYGIRLYTSQALRTSGGGLTGGVGGTLQFLEFDNVSVIFYQNNEKVLSLSDPSYVEPAEVDLNYIWDGPNNTKDTSAYSTQVPHTSGSGILARIENINTASFNTSSTSNQPSNWLIDDRYLKNTSTNGYITRFATNFSNSQLIIRVNRRNTYVEPLDGLKDTLAILTRNSSGQIRILRFNELTPGATTGWYVFPQASHKYFAEANVDVALVDTSNINITLPD